MTRCAIYARYSSDRQSEHSAEDQARLCQEYAAREGWDVVGVYSDLAVSGTALTLPGRDAMLAAIESYDVVLAEHSERVSRDQVDLPAIWRRIRFAGRELVTLAEGAVTELHVGLGSTMSALFLKGLGEKTRRGQIGRVEAGKIPGGLSYGYAIELEVDARGRPARGGRRIDPDQAEVVRRIFADYLAGISPKAIATSLNREGVPSPSGRTWGASTILGNRRRGTGILHNELYIGRIVYNRQRFEKHPDTRKRVARLNPEHEWRIADVPELRIIDRATWDAVQFSFAALAGVPARQQNRPKRLLSGLVRCGICGGNYAVTSRDYWGCTEHRKGGRCANRTMIAGDALESRVLDALRDKMLAPDVVTEWIEETQRLEQADRRDRAKARASIERRHARAQSQIGRLVDAIADGRSTMPEISARLRELAGERDRLAAELADCGAETAVTAHPNLAEIYRREIGNLIAALRGPDAHDARAIIRDMVDTIVATPRNSGSVDLDLQGRLAAILSITNDNGRPSKGTAVGTLELVAGTGFEPVTFRL